MNSFKKFLNIGLVAVLLLTVSVANAQIRFLQPSESQTGSYSVSNVDLGDGVVTLFPRTGALLEVIPSGAVVLGFTVPDNSLIVWGSFTFPDLHLNFQTPVVPIVYYNRWVPVTVFTSTFTTSVGEPTVTILGEGYFIFDPLSTGDGHTVDLLLNVSTSYVAYRQVVPVGEVRYRFERYVTSSLIQSCDRSGVVDFSPAPPVTQCD